MHVRENEEESLSFSRLVNRIHATTERSLAMERHVKEASDVPSWQAALREKLAFLLGINDLLLDRQPPAIDHADGDDVPDIKGVEVEYIYVASWLGTWIPAYILKATGTGNRPRPAVLCLHGHGESKDSQCGVWNRGRNSITAGIDLARRGFLTMAIDHWGFNERGFGCNAYDANEKKYNLNLLLYGRTINGLRVYDAVRCIDHLVTRPDVDPGRIGCIGLSLGGTITTYTAAIDTRIRAAVIEGYANTYKASIVDTDHCSCNYIPGLLQHAEMPDILGLIAPRPSCWVTGVQDAIFPLQGFREAEVKVRGAYQLLGAAGLFETHVHPRGHEYLGGPELDFLDRHLAGTARAGE